MTYGVTHQAQVHTAAETAQQDQGQHRGQAEAGTSALFMKSKGSCRVASVTVFTKSTRITPRFMGASSLCLSASIWRRWAFRGRSAHCLPGTLTAKAWRSFSTLEAGTAAG